MRDIRFYRSTDINVGELRNDISGDVIGTLHVIPNVEGIPELYFRPDPNMDFSVGGLGDIIKQMKQVESAVLG